MKKWPLILITCAVLVSCSTKQTVPAAQSSDSAEWVGLYTGILPCADCYGIYTLLELKANQTFVLQTKYKGKSVPFEIVSDSFTYNSATKQITLILKSGVARPVYYRLDQNKIIQLDMSGKPIESALAPSYELYKADVRILNKEWQLIELYGKPMHKEATISQIPTINFTTAESSVNGFSGCNKFFGQFEITKRNNLMIPPLASTLMACQAMETEGNYMRAIQAADHFYINGDTLILNKAKMAPLAIFVATKP